MERKVSRSGAARMKRLGLVVAIAAAVCVTAPPSRAGSVMGTGGGTEVTQILNNIALIKNVAQTAETVRNTVKTALYLKRSLETLSPGTIARMTGVPIDQVRSLAKLDVQLGGLMDSANDVQGVLQDVASGSSELHMTPGQYLQHMANNASRMGGVYKQSFDNDRAQMNGLQDQINQIQQTADSQPQIVSQVQGLQQLLAQNTQMQSTLVSMNQAVVKANALAAMQGQQMETQKVAERIAQKHANEAMQQLQKQKVSLPDPMSLGPSN